MIEKFVGKISPKTKRLKLLFQLIRQYGPISRAALIEKSNYKPATCNRLIEELVNNNLIIEEGYGISSGGRKPALYTINSNYRHVIGIDIASSFTRFALLNLNLDIVDSYVIKVDKNMTLEYLLENLTFEINKLVNRHNLQNKLLGVGIGDTWTLEKENEYSTVEDSLINNRHFNHFIEKIREEYNVIVKYENGIQLAALGEYRKNYWKTAKSITFAYADMTLKASHILQANLNHYQIGIEGNIGHSIVDITGRKCYCGSYGCLETYSGFRAITNEIQRKIKLNTPSLLQEMIEDVDNIHLEDILYALDQGDSLCKQVIRDAAFYFGMAITNIVLLTHTDIIIVGGGLGQHPYFYEIAEKTARERLNNFKNYPVLFSKPSIKFNGIVLGAGCMIIDYFTL